MVQRTTPSRQRRPGGNFSTGNAQQFDKSPAGVRAAKQAALGRLALGESVATAMKAVGRTENTYREWRKLDRDFAEKANDARAQARKKAIPQSTSLVTNREVGVQTVERAYYSAKEWTFEEFRAEFLGEETYEHMREWAALLEEGPDGAGLAAAREEGRLQCGSPKRLIINEPPFHGKTAVVSMSYALYRICMNLNVRIIMVSKTIDMAKKILYGIKQRLTDPRWSKLQAEFGPPGGFKPQGDSGATWAQDAIYVAGTTSGEKDPTVQAVGIGGTIYGARTDLSILDDISDLTNAHQFDKQIDYIEQDLASRGKDAKIILVGTRTGRRDVYQELADPHRYITGKSPWTRLVQPAVKEYADDPKDWVTLWPRAARPLDANSEDVPDEDGMYSAWDGPALSFVRGSMSPWRWSLVYQQEESVEDSVFKPEAVWGSVDRRRKPGPMSADTWGGAGVPRESLWTIASMDPAMTNDTAIIVESIDKVTRKRWLENAWVHTKPSPRWIRETIKSITDEYGVNEWIIEKNAFQIFLTQDEEIVRYLQERGCVLRGHYTGSNKNDPDFGVASLESLFGSLEQETTGGKLRHKGDNLIVLPDPDKSVGVRKLIEQLLTWEPNVRGSKLTMDLPMALWFAELAARSRLGAAGAPGVQMNAQVKSRFMSSRRRGQLRVIG